MKKLIIGNLVAASLLFASCGNAQNKAGEANTETSGQEQSTSAAINKDVDVAEFESFVQAHNGVLLDVRTPEEYAEGHLEGSQLIDINNAAFKDEVAKLDRNTPVYVYCRSGGRSGRAADIMTDMGFKEVYNLEGGIMAWQRDSKPVVK